MKKLFLIILFCILNVGILIAQNIGQVSDKDNKNQESRIFSNSENGYQITLQPGWSVESSVDNEGNHTTEIIFQDRSYALLRLKKIKTDNNSSQILTQIINDEIDRDLRFRHDYTEVGRERLVTSHGGGTLFKFDYKKGGKPISGYSYYLKTSPETVWILSFSGEKKYFNSLRPQIDQLVRTFKPLP